MRDAPKHTTQAMQQQHVENMLVSLIKMQSQMLLKPQLSLKASLGFLSHINNYSAGNSENTDFNPPFQQNRELTSLTHISHANLVPIRILAHNSIWDEFQFQLVCISRCSVFNKALS